MNVLTETFSEEDLETGSIEEEIELVMEQLRDTQPEELREGGIEFYIDDAGVAVMKFGDTLAEEIPRTGFRKGSDVKRLMRKLEDLAYAKKHGEFPDSAPRYTLIGHEPAEREKKTEEHSV